MDFENEPSVKARGSRPDDFGMSNGGEFEVPDRMLGGIPSNKHKLTYSHPLEASERNYLKNQDQMNFRMLQRIQGIHAPLKLKMEQKLVNKMCRLPFLESSNALYDSLTGKDLEIGFDDVLNTMEFREQLYQPHAVVEKSLGLL